MVSTKQALHSLIDRLSEEEAQEALVYLGGVADERNGNAGPIAPTPRDSRSPQVVSVREFRMRPSVDWRTLAAQQGVKPIERFDDLIGDFWPEDETADDLIAAVREWRREGRDG